MNKLKVYKFIVNMKKKMTSSLDIGCRVGASQYVLNTPIYRVLNIFCNPLLHNIFQVKCLPLHV